MDVSRPGCQATACLPAFSTAVGRALLGRYGDAELKARLASAKREALTRETVTDPKRLLTAIAADRARGYSLVDREAEPHFRSIAVPVKRYDGAIVAAINIGAHVDRVSTEEMVNVAWDSAAVTTGPVMGDRNRNAFHTSNPTKIAAHSQVGKRSRPAGSFGPAGG